MDANSENDCRKSGATETSVYALFSTRGPYIKNAAVDVSPKKVVVGHPVKINVTVNLAADWNFPTGMFVFIVLT